MVNQTCTRYIDTIKYPKVMIGMFIIYLSMIHSSNCMLFGRLIQNAVSNCSFLNPYHYSLERG